MTKKYERVCWYCEGQDIEGMGDYVRCQACGATWNELPDPGSAALTSTRDPLADDYWGHAATSGSPSGSIKRRSARARGDLQPAKRPEITA